MHPKFRYRARYMQTVVDFTKLVLNLLAASAKARNRCFFLLTTSCFAVQFRASLKGKTCYVQHLKPAFQRK